MSKCSYIPSMPVVTATDAHFSFKVTEVHSRTKENEEFSLKLNELKLL